MNAEKQNTILIVEDEAIIAMTEKMTIEKYGYEVITANTGEEAVALVDKTPTIDLILMDIDLGKGMDGTEAAETILRDHDIPIVFLSSHTEPEIVAKTEKITAYGFIVKNSSTTVFQALIKMVFKLFESKSRGKKKESQDIVDLEALRASEERFRSIINTSPDGISITDMNGRIIMASPALLAIVGCERKEEMLGRLFTDFVSPEDLHRASSDVSLMPQNSKMGLSEYHGLRPDGSAVAVEVNGDFVRDAKGRPTQMVFIIRDISERKRAEAALQKSEMQRKVMLENSPVVILLIQKGKLIYMNPAAEKFTGWQEKEYIGKNFASFVHKDDMEIAIKNNRERMGGNSFLAPYVLRILKKTGGFVYAEINGTVIDLDGKPTMLGFLTDITERKLAEEEIKRQLAEKEILLKEVHHRIKNNLTSIGGLLTLHMQAITSPEAVAALQDAIGRVNSMRLLYDKLLLGADFRNASTKNYIESLATSVVSLFPDQAKVKLDLDVDDFTLDPKRLFPLGIIINELLTNIMKYAFAGKKSGTIKLSLAKDGARVTLTLQDNGAGLPSGFDFNASEGFGLKLVKMLSQQLKGTFSIEKHKGMHCRLEFDI